MSTIHGPQPKTVKPRIDFPIEDHSKRAPSLANLSSVKPPRHPQKLEGPTRQARYVLRSGGSWCFLYKHVLSCGQGVLIQITGIWSMCSLSADPQGRHVRLKLTAATVLVHANSKPCAAEALLEVGHGAPEGVIAIGS